jgi:toxin ParE1/3/4
MADLRFLPEAEDELMRQIAYYASIRPELGVRFEAAVAETVRMVAKHPQQGAPRAGSTRRRLVKGFPFAVVYRATADDVLIVAIADGRRRPEYWAERLG